MTENTIVFLLVLFLNIFICVSWTISIYDGWIKRKSLERQFKTWKNTKKSFVWFLIWTIAIWLNVLVCVIVFFVWRSYDENNRF